MYIYIYIYTYFRFGGKNRDKTSISWLWQITFCLVQRGKKDFMEAATVWECFRLQWAFTLFCWDCSYQFTYPFFSIFLGGGVGVFGRMISHYPWAVAFFCWQFIDIPLHTLGRRIFILRANTSGRKKHERFLEIVFSGKLMISKVLSRSPRIFEREIQGPFSGVCSCRFQGFISGWFPLPAKVTDNRLTSTTAPPAVAEVSIIGNL